MKPKTLILMLVAVVCGLAAAYMAMNLTGKEEDPGDKVTVMVAAGPLASGVKLTDVNVQLIPKKFPKDLAPPNFVSDPQTLNGKVLGRALEKDMPVTLKDMSQIAHLFPEELDQSYRAFTVRVNLESSISGFLLPGARVDLLCAMHNLKNPSVKVMATFMQDVLVLAVNAQKELAKDSPNVIANAATITLAIKADEVQRVAWVTDTKQVMVSLRRPGYDKKEILALTTSPFGGDEGKGDGTEAEKPVGIPVAKVDIAPGTVTIDSSNFDKYFEILQVPPSLVRGNPIRNREQIQGMINHLVARGQPVTRMHLGIGDKIEAPVVTEMVIQVGGQPARIVRFENGKQIGNDGAGNPPTPRESLPQPEGAGPPKPGISSRESDGRTEK